MAKSSLRWAPWYRRRAIRPAALYCDFKCKLPILFELNRLNLLHYGGPFIYETAVNVGLIAADLSIRLGGRINDIHCLKPCLSGKVHNTSVDFYHLGTYLFTLLVHPTFFIKNYLTGCTFALLILHLVSLWCCWWRITFHSFGWFAHVFRIYTIWNFFYIYITFPWGDSRDIA